jgi:trigger factor
VLRNHYAHRPCRRGFQSVEMTSVKITTEKLPKSLLSLQIELDQARFERGLDQAARRLSQKFPIHGFRPGKAPRFMIERTYGRPMLIEEASESLINQGYQAALKQEGITPLGAPKLDSIVATEPFTFIVHVPVAPTVTVADYTAIRVDEPAAVISDEQVGRELDARRDRHVTLHEIEEPRPAAIGDQVVVKIKESVEGSEDEAGEAREQTFDLEAGRLVDELFAGIQGMNIGETKSITAAMPEDHANEAVRGKQVVFEVELTAMRRREVPEWDALPGLEGKEGSLDDLRAAVRTEMELSAQKRRENAIIDGYITQLLAGSEFDIPDAMIDETAHGLLHDQERQFQQYGITLEQMLQFRGQTHDQAVQELYPQAEEQIKRTLALREVVNAEGLTVSEDELDAEVETLLLDYPAEQHEQLRPAMRGRMVDTVANIVMDRKLRATVLRIAQTAAAAEGDAAPAEAGDEA